MWLFAVIAIASSVGTFIPQGEKIYHSWWFIALLALMGFDVIVCKLRGLPRISPLDRQKKTLNGENLVLSQPLTFRMVAPCGAEEARGRLAQHLGRQKYSLRRYDKKPQPILQAVRFKWQGWGDFVVHVSIVLILLGALAGAVWGFKEFLMVVPGQTRPMENRPWTVAVDDFRITYYAETGQPSRYASDVRLFDGETLVTKSTIIVNEPLDVGGVRFYQASWGMTGMLESATLQVGRSLLPIKRGEAVRIPGTPLSVELRMLYPDFDIDESGRPTTKSLEPNNPAVLVEFFQGGEPLVSMWLFKKRPEVSLRVGPHGELSPAAHPPFRLADFKPVLFSGIQVSYDPGARLFWVGCAALLAGLILRFYFHHRRLMFWVKDEGRGRSHVYAGGWSSRGAEDFRQEFQALMGSCQRTLSGEVI